MRQAHLVDGAVPLPPLGARGRIRSQLSCSLVQAVRTLRWERFACSLAPHSLSRCVAAQCVHIFAIFKVHVLARTCPRTAAPYGAACARRPEISGVEAMMPRCYRVLAYVVMAYIVMASATMNI